MAIKANDAAVKFVMSPIKNGNYKTDIASVGTSGTIKYGFCTFVILPFLD